MRRFGVSERRACKVVGQPRSTQRSTQRPKRDLEERIIEFLKAFAPTHSRQGYKRAYRAANEVGEQVNRK